MPDARHPRTDDRPPAGLSVGLLIVGGVIAVHLFFALMIGLRSDGPASLEPGAPAPAVSCGTDPDGADGSTSDPGACGSPGSPAPVSPAEPAVGGRGSY